MNSHATIAKRAGQPMSKFSLVCIAASLLCAVTAPRSTLAAEGTKHEAAPIPNFAPDPTIAWTLNRPAHDDFLPPPSGPGPVLADKAHPYVPNGQGQPTYRVADLTNPILKPWVIERMRSEEHTSELQSHLNLVCR